MISTYTTVDVFLDDVSEIRIEPISEGLFSGKQRWITVKTSRGETYSLRLQALDGSKLEIRELPDVENDWLTPKVYKGRSMTELEEDQPEAE